MIFLCTYCSSPNLTAPTETNVYHWDHNVLPSASLHGTLLVTGQHSLPCSSMHTQSPSAQPTCFDCLSQLQCQTKPYPSNWPFHDKLEDATILFSILIKGIQINPAHFHFPKTHPFTFIVLRHAPPAHIPPLPAPSP